MRKALTLIALIGLLPPAFGQFYSSNEELRILRDIDFLCLEANAIGPSAAFGFETISANNSKVRHMDVINYFIGISGGILTEPGDFGGTTRGFGYEHRRSYNLFTVLKLDVFIITAVKASYFQKKYNWYIDENWEEIDIRVKAKEYNLAGGIGFGYRKDLKNGTSISLVQRTDYFGFVRRQASDPTFSYVDALDWPGITSARFFDIEITVPIDFAL